MRELRVNASRHDVAHAYVVLAMVQHHGFGEAIESEFRGIVSGSPSKGILSREAADVDDVASARRFHSWYNFVATVVHTRKIQVDHAMPILRGQLFDRCEDAETGVVHQDVDGPELFFRETHKQMYVIRLRNVAFSGKDPAGMLRRKFARCAFDAFLGAAAEHHSEPFLEQSRYDCASDSARPTGDNCGFICE